MQKITSSLFGLVKSANGFYKSEQQAAFLSKFFDGGVYVTRQSLTFGEYEGRTNRNTASVEWAFYADGQGITKVEKTTSKGTVIYWERLSPEAFAAKLDAFENVKTIARNCVKSMILATGSTEEKAKRVAEGIVKNQDDIEAMMPDLSKFPEFVEAWEAFTNPQ